MLIDITNFNFECGDKGGSVLIDFNFACDCNNNGGTETYNLELNLKDFGHGYGSFKLNDTKYSPTKTPYKLNFTDELTSFSLNTSNVTEIISFPNTSKVKSLNSVFSYSPITNLDLRDWDLSSIEDVDFAFSYMQKCTNIKFNTDILKDKTSAQGLFGGCYALETVNGNDVVLGASTSDITNANYMFYGCKKIQSVNLDPLNITNASNMFGGCTSLTSINGGKWNSVTDASYMFSNCSSLDMNYFSTNNMFWQDLISSNCTNMSGMFKGCNFGNSRINFPSSWKVNYVTDMSYLFANSNLGDFSRPSNWDWWRCSNFSHMFEGNPMNHISLYGADWANATDFSYMFKDCWNLNTVDFGDAYNLTGVTNVEGMFEGCTSLQEVYCSDCDAYDIIKRGLESSGFDSSIIKGCDCSNDITAKFNVTSTTIPTVLCNSGKETAFTEMYVDGEQIDVTSSHIFSTLGEHTVKFVLADKTEIDRDAFYTCRNLTEIVIPESITYIGQYAFGFCSSLTEIVIPDKVSFITNGCFYECSSLTSVTIGSGVTSIGNLAFNGCTSLTSVTIPSSVTSIGSSFKKCSGLTSVTIGSGVTSIGDSAFDDCIRLTEITCLPTTAPTLNGTVFVNLPTHGTFYVPQGSDYSTWTSILNNWTIQYI